MATAPVVNEHDKQWGIIVSAITMLLIAIYLFLAHFQFADPPPKDIPLAAEMPVDELVMEELKIEAGGAGGGTPSDDEVAPPTPQVTNVITQKESTVTIKSGSSNKTNTKKNTDNTATTTQQSTNPFGGGSGGGSGGGTGGAFGSDTGKGGSGGTGTGSGAGRIRYNEINVGDIYTTVEVIVNLKILIDANGKVTFAQNMSGTTTTDQRIINQVIAAAKSQLKYSKESGAGLQTVFYTAKIVPN